ncbi:hypothetical protein [Micromonospora aurantiaca (nom. illeg.)]
MPCRSVQVVPDGCDRSGQRCPLKVVGFGRMTVLPGGWELACGYKPVGGA